MKLLLLLKSSMMFLILFLGCHLVSVPHFDQPLQHGKLIAVESVSSFETTNLQEEDQKRFDLFLSGPVKGYVIILAVMITALLIMSSTKSRRILQHFLYSVYYQSSYFSKDHLYPA